MDVERKVATTHGVVLVDAELIDCVRASSPPSTIIRASDLGTYFDHAHGLEFRADEFGGTAIMSNFEQLDRKSSSSSATPTIATGTAQRQKYRVLGTLSLISIAFFASGGGPVGSEPIISAGGPLVGLLGLAIYVIACIVPLSLVITELSCAFPENSGYSVWTMTAFGPYWGFQVGFWSWVASVTNNAIYPGLIYDTVVNGYGVEATSTAVSFFVKVAIAIVLALPSYVGVRFVGTSALVLLVLVCLSTVVFTAWGFIDGNRSWFRLAEVRGPSDIAKDSNYGGIDWSLLIQALFWSFDGLYDVSVIGGEVFNPARTFPRVIFGAAAITALTYLLPLIAAVTADRISWLKYVENSYPDIAEAIGGRTLNRIIVVSSVLSSVGMFTCTLFFQSFLVQGMAQSRLLPLVFRKRSARFKTPQYAILFSLVVTVALVEFDFNSILDMTNAFSAAVQILILLSMLKLRLTFPYLPRPTKVPGNMVILVIMLVPITCVLVFVLVTTLAQWRLAVIVASFTVVGLVVPYIRDRLAGRVGCC